MSNVPPTPAERFAILIALLGRAVAAHTGWDRVLTPTLIGHITNRLRRIKWAFIGLAARVQAGRYRPRSFAPRSFAPRALVPRPGAAGRRPANPLPTQRNWLEPMLPEVVYYRGHLLHLLQDAEMVALIQAAPEALGRPLRSLCRLLGLRPPPILAKPPRAAPAATPPAPAAEPQAPRPAPPRVRPPSAPAIVPAIVPAILTAAMRRKPA